MIYRFNDCVLDTDRRELRRGQGCVPVEPQVFDLLVYLLRNRGRVVSKEDILAAVWDGRIVSESTLTTRITAVRHAIGDNGIEQRLIRTVARKGIRFVGGVAEQVAPATEPTPQPTVAVLPFNNLSGDVAQEYFADGIVEDIITALSRLRWFNVVARNSTFAYKGKTVDVRQVGRELGARYVLEGSVRRSGTRVRITGQLVDAASSSHIWADSFDGVLEDIFALQDRITASVVTAIDSSLQRAEVTRLKRDTVAVTDLYGLTMRAGQLALDLSRESVAEALSYLHRALEIDPNFAGAMALAASCYAHRRREGWAEDTEGEAALALRLAERALVLTKDDGIVLWLAASALWQFGPDRRRAREVAQRSVLVNPNSAWGLWFAAMIETTGGNSAAGLEILARVEALNPTDPMGCLVDQGKALAHYLEDRLDEAVSFSQGALAKRPDFVPALWLHAASLGRVGQSKRAAEQIEALLAREPGLTLTEMRDRSLHMTHDVWSKVADGLRMAGLPE